MKLLIIAGPSEADQIRQAAVMAGLDAVAIGAAGTGTGTGTDVAAGLPGWIAATQADVILLSPETVDADPEEALTRVRSGPRGRVPVFLLAGSDDVVRLQGVGDGLLVRPVSTDQLRALARQIAVPGQGPADDQEVTPMVGVPFNGLVHGEAPRLKPLWAGARLDPPFESPPPFGSVRGMGANLAANIDADLEADLDAELREVVRSVGGDDGRAGSQEGSRRRAPRDAAGELAPGGDPGVQGDPVGEAIMPWLGRSLFPPTDAEEAEEAEEAAEEEGVVVVEEVAPVGERVRGADRASVLARHALVLEGTYFEILGVLPDSSPTEIRLAAEQVLAELTAEKDGGDGLRDLTRELDEIREVVVEAARLMTDDQLRARYRKHLVVRGQSLSSSPAGSVEGSPTTEHRAASAAEIHVEMQAEPAADDEDLQANRIAGIERDTGAESRVR